MNNNKKLITGIGANVYDTLIMLPEYPTEDTKMKADAISSVGGGPTATGLVAAAKLGVGDVTVDFIGSVAGGRQGKISPWRFREVGRRDGICHGRE